MTTPLETFAFPVTGGSTNLSLPGRLGNAAAQASTYTVTNVKEFGATGDGVTDDWAKITDAFSWNNVTLECNETYAGVSSSAIKAVFSAAITNGALSSITATTTGTEYNQAAYTAYALTVSGGASIRATISAVTIVAGAVTDLVIGVTGKGYTPSTSYTITFTGGTGVAPTAHALSTAAGDIADVDLIVDTAGSGLAGTWTAVVQAPPTATLPVLTVTPTAGGNIGTAQITTVSPGSNMGVAPTVLIEFPGHVVTLTFTAVAAVTTSGGIAPGTTYAAFVNDTLNTNIIGTKVIPIAVDTGAKTITLRAPRDYSGSHLSANTTCITGAGVVPGTLLRFCSPNIGTFYFPPGTYRVSQPIDINGSGLFMVMRGEGNISKLVGNFDDYVVTRGVNESSDADGLILIRSLAIENEHATGGGLRLGDVSPGEIRDLDVTACKGINTYNFDVKANNSYWGTLDLSIENCRVTPGSGRRTGSIGISSQAEGPVRNCIFYDYETGFTCAGGQGGIAVNGNLFELCTTGMYNGLGPNSIVDSISRNGYDGNYFKNCGTGVRNVGGEFGFNGNYIYAAASGAPGGVNADYGIRWINVTNRFGMVGGVYVEGTYAIGGFWFQGNDLNTRNLLITGVYSDSWVMTDTPGTGWFFNNNIAAVYAVAKLPTPGAGPIFNAFEGDEFNVSNSNTTTFAATIAAGAPNAHVKARFNGSVWTVAGI